MKEKMKNTTIIAYGCGSLGKDLALGVIGSYLLIFYTDILGISAAAAGTILVVTKIWDAVNDPIMGSIVDRTRTKWGRFRPYLLLVPIPLALFSALCFAAPDWTVTAKTIYALVTYTITGMLFTAYDVPLWGMVPIITNNRDDSNKCISSARFFTSLGMFVAMTFAYPLIQFLGGGSANENLKSGYPRFMMIIGVVSVVFAWITFGVTKEKPLAPDDGKKERMFRSFLEVIRERDVRIVFFTMILQAVAMILPNVIGAYYVIYYWGKPDMVAVYFALCSIVGLATAPVTAILLKKIDAKKLTVMAMSISAILSMGAFFIPSDNIPLLLVVFAIFGFTMPVPMVSVTTLLVEAGNELERKTGTRKDGVLFSLNSFAIKCGTALASGIVSAFLAVTKYQAASPVQSAGVLEGIHILRTLMIAGVYLLGIGIIRGFGICEKKTGR